MSNATTTTYNLPAPLVQGLVNHLLTRPGSEGFELLLAIKVTCEQQDAQRAMTPLPSLTDAADGRAEGQ